MAKKNRKGKGNASIYCQGMTPTKERQQKAGGIIIAPIHEKNGNKTYITQSKVQAECTLDHYKVLKKITESEFAAGIKFRRAYLCAVEHIKTEDSFGSHGDIEMAYINPIYSEQILRQAYAVLSRIQKSVVIDVCGHDYGAGNTSRIMTLRRGLGALAKLWRLP